MLILWNKQYQSYYYHKGINKSLEKTPMNLIFELFISSLSFILVKKLILTHIAQKAQI
jgi:hypothetical protein